MQVHCWGVRGLVPVPGPSTVKFGGNTTCFSVSIGDGHQLILDAGTGVRNIDIADRQVFLLVFSHVHHDHQQGLPFFPAIYFPRPRPPYVRAGTYEAIAGRRAAHRAIRRPHLPGAAQ